MNRTVVGVAVLAAVVGVSGCGGNGGSGNSGSTDDAFSGVPACSDIWQVGKTIDLSKYNGCMDGDTQEIAMIAGCYDQKTSKYRGQFATYKDKLWVIQTGTDPKTGSGGKPGKVTDVDPKC